MCHPVFRPGPECQLGVSIGIALLHQGMDNQDQVLAAADSAMYSVKQTGKNGFRMASSVL
ncbi:diguanylate cyclase domain-containing protein [Oceanisphaera litoralis]|uniref:diguanylate cyclase domain-containing protein n=1 Tax=Oceanisphaera litoralis TaxID=225144 RepID=UPI00308424A6